MFPIFLYSRAKSLKFSGSSYVEVEEILLESQVALLRKHSSNLLEKIQIQDEQLRNMRNLEETNRKLTQQYNINMEKR
jgi:hypothetical protein